MRLALGQLVKAGGAAPPTPAADACGVRFVWHVDESGSHSIYEAEDETGPYGSDINLIETLAGKVGLLVGSNRNNPPSLPKERNYISTDGVNWLDVTSSPGNWWDQGVAIRVGTIVYLEIAGVWLMKEGTGARTWTSYDGISWTPHTAGYGPSTNFSKLGYFNDGVYDFILTNNQLYSTQDGINWTLLQNLSSTSNGYWDPGQTPAYWLFGGSSSSPRIYSSADGSAGSFVRMSAAEDSLDDLNLLSYSGLQYAHSRQLGLTVCSLGAAGGGTSTQRDAYSSDNLTWNGGGAVPVAPALWYSTTFNKFVKPTFNFSDGSLYTSPDGVVWTQRQYAAFQRDASGTPADLLSCYAERPGYLPSFDSGPGGKFTVRDSVLSLTSSNFAEMNVEFYPSNFAVSAFRRRIGGLYQQPPKPLGYDDSLPLQYVSGSTVAVQIRVIDEGDPTVPFDDTPFPNGPDVDGWYNIHNNTTLWSISNVGGPLGTLVKEITFELRENPTSPVGARFRKTLVLTRTP